jgi:hypothetical protein
MIHDEYIQEYDESSTVTYTMGVELWGFDFKNKYQFSSYSLQIPSYGGMLIEVTID